MMKKILCSMFLGTGLFVGINLAYNLTAEDLIITEILAEEMQNRIDQQ